MNFKSRGRSWLPDLADHRLVEFGDDAARHHLLVVDDLAATKDRRAGHVGGVEPLQPLGRGCLEMYSCILLMRAVALTLRLVAVAKRGSLANSGSPDALQNHHLERKGLSGSRPQQYVVSVVRERLGARRAYAPSRRWVRTLPGVRQEWVLYALGDAAVLVLDNYDSFVFNLVQYLGELGRRADRAPQRRPRPSPRRSPSSPTAC